MAKSERSKSKATAWTWFSKYIRLRDTPGRCCTCGAHIEFSTCDAGHYIPGRKDAYLFDEHNCHGQCPKCNRFLQGCWVEYEAFIIDKYGGAENERLKGLKNKVVKLTVADYRAIAKEYRIRYHELLESF
jgi:hypothetical protein